MRKKDVVEFIILAADRPPFFCCSHVDLLNGNIPAAYQIGQGLIAAQTQLTSKRLIVDPSTANILEDMVNTGVTNISIDAPSDLAKAVEVTRGKAVLIGNVNTNLFYSGSKEAMEQDIKNCLAVAPKDSGYILASGCEVPGVAPPEKVDWFMELIDELCKEN